MTTQQLQVSFRGGHVYRSGWLELWRHLEDVLVNRPVPTLVFKITVMVPEGADAKASAWLSDCTLKEK